VTWYFAAQPNKVVGSVLVAQEARTGVERRKRGFHCRKQLLFALEAAGRPPMRLQIGNDLLLDHLELYSRPFL
jgi:hypothetical protein